jgi:hypothetical protein
MSTVLFISPEVLRERTALHDNTDNKFIFPEIKAAQDQYIAPILGTALYKKMLAIVGDGTISSPANIYYKELLDDYLVPSLVWFTIAALPLAVNYQLTNRGMVQKTTENTNAPTMSDMFSAMDHYKNRAEHYQMKAIRYLRQWAPERFPEYLNWGNGIDDIAPERSEFSLPIYLGDDMPEKPRPFSEYYQGNGPR